MAPAQEDFDGLIQRVGRHRDREAFSRLFTHFYPRVRGYLMRLGCEPSTSDDLAQDVMVNIWRAAATFDPARASAAAWIFAITRNRRIDRLRRERRPEPADESSLAEGDIESMPDRAVERRQIGARLAAALRELPAEQSKLLELAYYGERTHVELAKTLDLPLGTVKSRIRLALVQLRRTLRTE